MYAWWKDKDNGRKDIDNMWRETDEKIVMAIVTGNKKIVVVAVNQDVFYCTFLFASRAVYSSLKRPNENENDIQGQSRWD